MAKSATACDAGGRLIPFGRPRSQPLAGAASIQRLPPPASSWWPEALSSNAGSFSSKFFSQLVLGAVYHGFLFCGEVFSGAICIEIQHGHRRLKRRAFAAAAGFGGMFYRGRDPSGIARFENIFFEIHRVAPARHLGRPELPFDCGPRHEINGA